MADEDDGDDEAAAADGELNELDVRAAIARAPNDDRDAEGARPVDPFDRPALDEPIKVGSRKTADLFPDCGIVVSLAQLPQHRGKKRCRDEAERLRKEAETPMSCPKCELDD